MSTVNKENESKERLAAEGAGADDDVDDSSSSLKSSSDAKKEIVTTPNTGLPMPQRSDGELLHMLRLLLEESKKRPGVRFAIQQAMETFQHQCGLDFKFPPELFLLLAEYNKDDRVFYNTLTSLNKEIHEQSKALLPLWPQKAFELKTVAQGVLTWDSLNMEFSSDSSWLLVHQVSLMEMGQDYMADTTVLSTFNVRSGMSSKEIRHPFPVSTSYSFRKNRFLLTHSPSESAIRIYDVENELSTATIGHISQGHELLHVSTDIDPLCGELLMTVTCSHLAETDSYDFHLSIWDFESKQCLLSIPNFFIEDEYDYSSSWLVFESTFVLFGCESGYLNALNFHIGLGIAHPVLQLAHDEREGYFSTASTKLNPKHRSIFVSASYSEGDKLEMWLWKLSSKGPAFPDGQPIIDSIQELCQVSVDAFAFETFLGWFPCGQYLLVNPDDDSPFILFKLEYDSRSGTWSLCFPSDRAPAVRLMEKANAILQVRFSAGWKIRNWRIAPNGEALAITLESGAKEFLQLVSV